MDQLRCPRGDKQDGECVKVRSRPTAAYSDLPGVALGGAWVLGDVEPLTDQQNNELPFGPGVYCKDGDLYELLFITHTEGEENLAQPQRPAPFPPPSEYSHHLCS